MTSIITEKDSLRRQTRQVRDALSPEWREAASHRIIERLWSLDKLKTAGEVHCYVAWRSEVATAELIERLLRNGKKVAIPKVDLCNHVLNHFYIQTLESLVIGAFGIPEPNPTVCEPASIADFSVIVVPGVAFDCSGNRLGSGHGYYDRFLAQSAALRIGLAFGKQIIDAVPVGSHDQRMNLVVTEEEIISCPG